MSDKKYFLNPTTLTLLIFAFSVMLMFSGKIVYLGILILSFLIAFFQAKKVFTRMFITYTIMSSLAYLIHVSVSIKLHWIGAFYAMLMILIKLTPVFVVAGVLASYSSSELMQAFRSIKFPVSITIGIAVFFRFLPEFISRMKDIKDGARIRGFNFSLFHPVRSFELFAVPLMVRALSVGDIISCSIITKGIEADCEKTVYMDMPFTFRDLLVIILTSLGAGGIIWKGL